MNPFTEEQKLFSICVPCYGDKYKHFKTFFKAMDDQEYKKFEVIIILDGPNRQAGKELKKLIKEYPEMDVSYFVIEHSGVCAARNEATKHAKGDYLAYPSPDCWYYPGSLRIFANEFEDPKITRVWGLYDPVRNGEVMLPVGAAPIGSDREVWYPSFKYSNFADCSFPVKKEIRMIREEGGGKI